MVTITGTWTLLHRDPQLQRSSQTLSSTGKYAIIFGGELKPREPRDNDVYALNLSPVHEQPYGHKAALQVYGHGGGHSDDPSPCPIARVGTTSATVDQKVYFFSGRGGVEMSPVDENGALWCFNFSDRDGVGWELIQPSDPKAPFPEARSYHCMTSDSTSKLYIHAGCPTSGRLNDLWSFDVKERAWTQLASAPGSPRGGTSIAYLDRKIYRMGGFDGKHEIGGALDVYDTTSDTWTITTFAPDGTDGPGARSVASLLALEVNGKKSLVTLFGESDPSALGHAGAGNMMEDVWVWDVQGEKWSKVVSEGETPKGRGWFAADVVTKEGQQGVIVQGGLDESNERLDDAWLLTF